MTSPPLALRYDGFTQTLDHASRGNFEWPWLGIEASTCIPVPRAGLVIGRGRRADVRLSSNVVAREHVRVEYDEVAAVPTLIATDLGSTHGIQSTRDEGTRHRLQVGDVLTLARCFHFEVLSGAGE